MIWDLDQTLWRGVLSEGPIEPHRERLALIDGLVRRGVMCSVVSKNDPDLARSTLDQLQVWQLLVFPEIGWGPKGPRVAAIIEAMNLRADNVLLVDDHPTVRAEVRHFCPGVVTADPSELTKSVLARWGKDDRRLSRLEHYRLLEQKAVARRRFPQATAEFLHSCDIVVSIAGGEGCRRHLDRIHELVERTHRLNFTGLRSSRQELAELLSDARSDCYVIWVRDRFGDYGLAGFCALSSGSLAHFLFSCRILDMGVESYLWQRLKRRYPKLSLAGSSRLEAAVDWIREEAGPAVVTPTYPGRPTIALRGACDLAAILPRLQSEAHVIADLQRPLENGLSDQFCPHSEYLRPQPSLPETLLTALTFVEPQTFVETLLLEPWDLLVFGPSVDYWSGLYLHPESGARIAAGWFFADLFSEDTRERYPRFVDWENRLGPADYLDDNRALVEEHLSFLGGVSPRRFRENLEDLCQRVPVDRRIVFVNVLDEGQALFPHGRELNPALCDRYHTLNQCLDAITDEHPHASLIDVRSLASEEDIYDMHTHLSHRCYLEIGDRILEIARAHQEEGARDDTVSTRSAPGAG